MSSKNSTRRKGNKQRCLRRSVGSDPEIQAEIQALFNKVKRYRKPVSEEWSIPDPNVALKHPPEDHQPSQELKASSNAVKNQLSDKDIQVWHEHTNSTNRAGRVITFIRHPSSAEMCTQAWCKFYEISGTFRLLPDEALQNGKSNSVHSCEAPGAFVTASNHYLKTNESTRNCNWRWVGNTSNPYHEANGGSTTIADDRLIANTSPSWFFGSDNTGNIMLQKHSLESQAFVSKMRRVDLVTADGSFDCQGNPDEQEASVASSHYCEATAASLLSSPGGSFVLKMFTSYEHSSVCLLYLSNCCFQSVSVFKPATSKAGNSEVYVVCLNYENKEAVRPSLSKSIRNYGPDSADREALFPTSVIPETFSKQHYEFCSFFHSSQVETINENSRSFEDMSTEKRQRLDFIRNCVYDEYVSRFKVFCISKRQWVSRNTVKPACCHDSAIWCSEQRKQTGSFNERKESQNSSWRERVGRSCHATWVQSHRTEDRGVGCTLEGPQSGCLVKKWNVIVGAASSAVRNSPFCDLGSLNHSNDASSEAEVDWTLVPPCHSCHVASTASVLSEAAALCVLKESEGGKEKKQCLVFGSRSAWAADESQVDDLVLTFCEEPSFPPRGCVSSHDGEPSYQQQLSACVMLSLQTSSSGDLSLSRVLSALTRVTAAVVFCSHTCFRSVSYRCPPPTGGIGALSVCSGFCPEAATRVLRVLSDVQTSIRQSSGGEDDVGKDQTGAGDRQVSQFVPMEELLNGGSTEFLWTMNSEIIQQKSHLLMQS